MTQTESHGIILTVHPDSTQTVLYSKIITSFPRYLIHSFSLMLGLGPVALPSQVCRKEHHANPGNSKAAQQLAQGISKNEWLAQRVSTNQISDFETGLTSRGHDQKNKPPKFLRGAVWKGKLHILLKLQVVPVGHTDSFSAGALIPALKGIAVQTVVSLHCVGDGFGKSLLKPPASASIQDHQLLGIAVLWHPPC